MARKKITRTTTEEEITPPAEVQPLDEVPASREEQEISQWLESFGASATKVKIWKFNRAGERGYCGTAEPSAVDEDYLKQMWGAGKYFLTIYGTTGYVGNRNLVIHGSDDPRFGPIGPTAAPNGPAVNQPTAQPQIELLREQVNRQHEMILKLTEGGGRGGIDLAEVIAAVKSIQAPAVDPMASVGVVINALKSGIELAQKANAPQDEKMGWVNVFEKALPLIKDTLDGFAKGRNGDMAPNPDPPDPMVQLRAGVGWLKSRALRSDPDLYVDFVLDNLDQAQWLDLAQIINLPEEERLKIDPDLGKEPYKTWFGKLFEGLAKEIKGRLEPEGESGKAVN